MVFCAVCLNLYLFFCPGGGRHEGKEKNVERVIRRSDEREEEKKRLIY